MVISRELVGFGEGLQRLLLPNALVAIHQIDHRGIEHKKTSIDPAAIPLGLFLKAHHAASLKGERPERARGLDGGQGGFAAFLLVECHEGSNVHIGHAVTVGEAERFIIKVLPHPRQTPPCEGGFPCVHKGHAPWFSIASMHLHAVAAHVNGDITGMQEIVGKILLDHITFIAAANNEILLNSIVAVNLEYVPWNWLAAHLNHRLWPCSRLLGDSSAWASSQNNSFHAFLSFRNHCGWP